VILCDVGVRRLWLLGVLFHNPWSSGSCKGAHNPPAVRFNGIYFGHILLLHYQNTSRMSVLFDDISCSFRSLILNLECVVPDPWSSGSGKGAHNHTAVGFNSDHLGHILDYTISTLQGYESSLTCPTHSALWYCICTVWFLPPGPLAVA